MKKPSKSLWPRLALAMGVALLSLGAIGCPPYPLEPGTDCWETQTGTQQRLKTLPAGFFGEVDGQKSNAMPNPLIELAGLPLDPGVVSEVCGCPEEVEYDVTWLDPHGVPTEPDSGHAVTQVKTPTTPVDTCIRRTVAADVKKEGVALKVDIELVKLSLQSVNPIEVEYGHGKPDVQRPKKSFDVFITESGTQKAGSMTFTTNSIASGKAKGDSLLGNLFVNYDVEFREVGNPANTFSRTGLSLKFSGTKGNFTR